MRTFLAFTVSATLLAIPGVALAQAECPPGAWFCEESATDPEPEPEPEPPPAPAAKPTPPSPPSKDTTTIVVVKREQEPPPKIVVVDSNPPKEEPPRAKSIRIRGDWGLNLRLQAALMGSGKDPNAGMGGFGVSLRYRPVPAFAADVGLDWIGGVDYQGADRGEAALSLNGIVFFNPRDPVQIYTLAGLAFSRASVTYDPNKDYANHVVNNGNYHPDYSYFGGQLGLGLEFRVSRHLSFNTDLIGFIRGRTDGDAAQNPEFQEATTGRHTNTSGGGLLRGGVTFYW